MMLNIIENILVSLCMVTCLSVIFVNNPIQSLLYLIISFALSSMLFMILGAEFVSLLVFFSLCRCYCRFIPIYNYDVKS